MRDDRAASDYGKELKPDGSFEIKNVRSGNYGNTVRKRFAGGSRTALSRSVTAGARNYRRHGIESEWRHGCARRTCSSDSGAGVIAGVVTGEIKEPAIGSAVVAVPEARFRKQASRAYGRTETGSRMDVLQSADYAREHTRCARGRVRRKATSISVRTS